MFNRITVLSILLAAADIISSATPSSEDAIRQVVQRYVDARNHFDEAALRELFTQDADQLVSNGQWRRGLENLLRGVKASSRKETGRSSVTVEYIRMLGTDVAIVDGRYETWGIGATTSRKMWSTFVLQHIGDQWRITAIRNMLPAVAVP